MIKWVIVIVCIVGIALTWILSSMFLVIHEAHGFATVREFESLHLIDLAKLEELKKEPQYKSYSIYGRVRAIGATNHYFEIFRFVLSLVFLAIMVLALSIPKPNRGHDTVAVQP
jgi:hypothetical protein